MSHEYDLDVTFEEQEPDISHLSPEELAKAEALLKAS